jgi:hypothetical protein
MTATTTDHDLDRRIRRLEDRLAIEEVISSYGILLDNRDYAAVGDLYTDDARFWQHVGETTDARTRQGIVDFYRERLGHSGPSYHYHHGTVITFDDDSHLRYHDAYVKGEDGRWRFSERETYFHYFMPADELPSRYSDEIRRTWPGQPLPADIPDGLDTYRAEPHAPYTVR